MNDIYIVVIEDRHCDVQVAAFLNRKDAIGFAKNEAAINCVNSEDIVEEKIEGWEYFCTYSCEGDCVRVEKIEVSE